MTSSLTEAQRAALDAYSALQTAHPSLFTSRKARPLVLDPAELSAHAAAHGVVLGVAADTPYFIFVVDLVESRASDGTVRRHPYLRLISRRQLGGGVNVVILATIENEALGKKGDIILVRQERHAPGTTETELPRGFGEPQQPGEAQAMKELAEETGYFGRQARLLGRTHPDTGLTDGLVSFFHVPVTGRLPPSPETSEAIAAVRLASIDEIWSGIDSGTIRDGFTLQALALFERSGLAKRP